MLRIRFKHSWGTAEKLYKSEAIDSFGNKYLLGVYETVKEAEKAFDEWNKEHPGRQHASFWICSVETSNALRGCHSYSVMQLMQGTSGAIAFI